MKKITFAALVLGVLVFARCGKDNEACEANGIDLTHMAFNPGYFSLQIPQGFPQMFIPANNPMSLKGVELGRYLFYDVRLSGDNTMSCASCHLQEHNFTDALAVSTGIDGIAGTRSAMPLVNIGFASVNNQQNYNFMWDGRFKSLEEQALMPVTDPIELHANWDDVACKLRADTLYQRLFREAFGITRSDEISAELAAKAIAQFERTMISASSKYDRWLLGLETFTPEEEHGYLMFFDAGAPGSGITDAQCGHCHNGSQLTNFRYTNNGLDYAADFESFVDKGLGRISGLPSDNGKFKTPTLRNIAQSAPYMHDGRFQTLEEVIDHYSGGGEISPTLAAEMQLLASQPPFTPQEKADLLAFLHTLTDSSFLNNPAFANPW